MQQDRSQRAGKEAPLARQPLSVAALALLVASSLLACWAGPAGAQSVYRCGNLYSQQPCADALPLDAADSRTAAQSAQTQAAASRAASSAQRMEKERLAQAAQAVANSRAPAQRAKPPASAASAPMNGPTHSPDRRKQKKPPEFFTAAAPRPGASKGAVPKASN